MEPFVELTPPNLGKLMGRPMRKGFEDDRGSLRRDARKVAVIDDTKITRALQQVGAYGQMIEISAGSLTGLDSSRLSRKAATAVTNDRAF